VSIVSSAAALLIASLVALEPSWLLEHCGCSSVTGIDPALLGLPVSPAVLGMIGLSGLLLLQTFAHEMNALQFAAILLGGQLYLVSWLWNHGAGLCAVCGLFSLLLLSTTAALLLGQKTERRVLAAGRVSFLALLACASLWIVAPEVPSTSRSVEPPAIEGAMVMAETFLEEGCSYCEEQVRQLERFDDTEKILTTVHLKSKHGWESRPSARRAQELGVITFPTTVIWGPEGLIRRFNALTVSEEVREAMAAGRSRGH